MFCSMNNYISQKFLKSLNKIYFNFVVLNEDLMCTCIVNPGFEITKNLIQTHIIFCFINVNIKYMLQDVGIEATL